VFKNSGQGPAPVGKAYIFGADGAESAKAGVIAELVVESLRMSAEQIAAAGTARAVDWVSTLPPGTGFLIGFLLRLLLAWVEDRGSVRATFRLLAFKTRELYRRVRTWFNAPPGPLSPV
jgi:hypothetical protein